MGCGIVLNNCKMNICDYGVYHTLHERIDKYVHVRSGYALLGLHDSLFGYGIFHKGILACAYIYIYIYIWVSI